MNENETVEKKWHKKKTLGVLNSTQLKAQAQAHTIHNEKKREKKNAVQRR